MSESMVNLTNGKGATKELKKSVWDKPVNQDAWKKRGFREMTKEEVEASKGVVLKAKPKVKPPFATVKKD